MNQDVLFSQYLEDLTDTITDLDHFNIEKTYTRIFSPSTE